jgi:nucleotide-binding universal stress UspA family protein
MFQSILVPLDGSTFGEHALPLALAVARRARAALTLVHVHAPLKSVYLEGAAFLDDSIEREIKSQQRAYLGVVAERLRAAVPDLKVNADVVEGPIGEVLVHEATSRKVDLVVMTTHGRGPIGRFWLGSVADELVRQLPMPLLLIQPSEALPDLSREPEMKHFLIPLDGSDLAEQILEPAVGLGKLMGADYTLMRVVKPVMPMNYPVDVSMAAQPVPASLEQIEALQGNLEARAQQYLDELAIRLREEGLRVQTRVEIEQQPGVAILGAVERHEVDLVAMETHGRRGLSRLFLGSVADKVIRGAHVPILVQRPVEK